MGEEGECSIVSAGKHLNRICLGHEEEGEQVRRADAITADAQIKEASDGHSEELLPGIPDQITLGLIIPKLPWAAFHILSSVSRCWRDAIQAYKIYDARVHANSTETLVVHTHSHGQTAALALYSIRDKCCQELPPIPHADNRIAHSCHCVALDGRLYVLGWEDPDSEFRILAIAEVFVLDLAGQRNWRRCASMQEPRVEFGSGVFEGKIFVFGGSNDNQPVLGSEVYDPEQDIWSSIVSMPSWRCEHRVATVGDELFVYGGRVKSWDDEYFQDSFFLDVYHPAKNEWRLVEPFGNSYMPCGTLAIAKGRLYLMTGSEIEVYDSERNLWEKRLEIGNLPIDLTISFPQAGPSDPLDNVPTATFAVDDEVVVVVHWYDFVTVTHGTDLFQSRGFTSETTQLEWETISCPFPFTPCACEVMSSSLKCTIQL